MGVGDNIYEDMRTMRNSTLLLNIILLAGCSNVSRLECGFGASSPVDLTLINDCDSDEIILLYFYDTSDGTFEFMKSLTVEKNENKIICIENEGSVIEGLYIKVNDRIKMIKLEYGQDFKLRLCDNSFVIERNKWPK